MKIPNGKFADDAAERRRRLAESLRAGETISVAPTGQVMTEDETNRDPSAKAKNIEVPEGKLAR